MEKLFRKAQKLSTLQNADLSRFEKYSQEQLWKVPEDGGWSLTQVLNHLYLTQKGTLNFVGQQLEDNARLEKITWRERINALGLTYYLRSKKKFKAPSRLPEPLNDTEFSVLKSKYEKLQAQCEDLASKFPNHKAKSKIFKHPRAGWLSITDVIDFMYNHWYHHQFQMQRLENGLDK